MLTLTGLASNIEGDSLAEPAVSSSFAKDNAQTKHTDAGGHQRRGLLVQCSNPSWGAISRIA